MELGVQQCRGILPRGGTILGSSRTNPFKIDGGVEKIKDNLAKDGVDALVAIGGEDTLGVATKLADLGVNVVGVPKTIDNDLSGTDFTFGFDTAVDIATEAIDRLHTTAESPPPGAGGRGDGPARGLDRAALRHRRWRQHHADPRAALRHREGLRVRGEPLQEPVRPDRRRLRGCGPKEGGDMTLATGEKDAFGHVRLGGIGDRLAGEIEQRTGKEARAVVLGHIQRGGTPTAFDRWLATRFGLAAVDAVADGDFGTMMALRGTDDRPAAPDRGDRRARSWSARRSTPRRRSSSADPGSGGPGPCLRAARVVVKAARDRHSGLVRVRTGRGTHEHHV